MDGIIVPNFDDTIKSALERVYRNVEFLNSLKKELNSRDYSNKNDVVKVYDLFEIE